MRPYCILLLLIFSVTVNAQHVDPLRTVDYEAQLDWVDSIIQSMTIDEKIGQLFMVQAYSNKEEKHTQEILELIEQYHVGNLIFMQGTPEKQATLTNLYQSKSKVPLLIGFDGEWGLDMRLKNTFRYPWNMTLGAVEDDALLEAFGARLGAHCKRLGIHVNFAPVVDINTNPLNPIIGNRSFGENKDKVTNKAIAFTKGMQKAGVLATAKHFPGHGDTATDSHLGLPVLNFDRKRLDSIELYPYSRLFDAGVGSVMTAHLSIPALEPNATLPTSLSPSVVTDVLQKELGFLGLIFTDGLNMKGAANYATPSQIDLAALLAGNDMLLIPQDVPSTVALFKNALELGSLTEERINSSVRKILRAKYWAGLHQYQPIALEHLQEDLITRTDEVLHRTLVQKSLTVLKNEAEILPIRNLDTKKIAYVALGDDSGVSFLSMLKNYAEVTEIKAANLHELLDSLAPYNQVLIGYHKSNANPWKDYAFSEKEIVWLQELAREKEVIVSVFASPYSLLQLKSFSTIEGLILSYQNSEIAQELTAQLIFGAIASEGTLPVSIKNEFSEGRGIKTSSLSRLKYGLPEEEGMSSHHLKKIDSIAQNILDEKMAPGMQVLVARNGKVVYSKAFGYHTDKKEFPVLHSDVYDVASLTKILASLPMIMKANEDKALKLKTRVKDLIPSFRKSNKANVNVKEMLSHYGRLQAWIPFYTLTQDSSSKKNLAAYYRSTPSEKYGIKVADRLYLNSSYKDSMYHYIREADQREEPGYKYSDLGYYIFKEALEQYYKQPLNTLVDRYFYASLGANRMSYLPLEKFPVNDIVPTEKDTYFRNQLLRGYVHDMGAAMQGGVGGHAGVFANANDVAKMMQMYLQKGYYGGKRYLKPSTIDAFNTRYFESKKVRRGLGFDKPQLNPEVEATCGCVSNQSFGHSGFTGTYTWADPESGIVYVFLSNRVYPTMDNVGLVTSNARTEIQRIIQEALLLE